MHDYHQHPIQPRRLDSTWPDDIPRYWNDNDVFATHFHNAMSPLFPAGEQMFIDSVRAHRHLNQDPQLETEIKGFIGQEAWHRKEHSEYDGWLERQGYPAAWMEKQTQRRVNFIKFVTPAIGLLAHTVCLEHFTAIMAKALLSTATFQQQAHPHMAKIWTWHAVEEIEHKAVAFDLYQTVGGGYLRRVLTMLLITLFFPLDVLFNLSILLWKDGKLFSPRVWWQGLRFLFWRKQQPGLLPKIFIPYLRFYSPWFHPWREDDRHLIQLRLGEVGFGSAGSV